MEIQFTGSFDYPDFETAIEEAVENTIDYTRIAENVNITDLASEIAGDISAEDVANEMDYNSVASYIDTYDVAQNIDMSSYISEIVDELVKRPEIAQAFSNSASNRIAELEKHIDALDSWISRVQFVMLGYAGKSIHVLSDDRSTTREDGNRHPIM
jgi:hypothetical protein